MTLPSTRRRRAAALSAAVLTGSLVLAPAAFASEGPGYGGTADELAVSWKETERIVAMGPPGASLDIEASGLALDIFGLGFRSRSEVVVTVGTTDPVTIRVDPTGTLDLEVGLEMLGAGPQPGTSVIVLGRAPSGTTRTLVGAVPPVPSGTGPADLVPWVVALALTGAGAVALRRRRTPAHPVG